jgi:hypothetical protein
VENGKRNEIMIKEKGRGRKRKNIKREIIQEE